MYRHEDETIAAIATPPGYGGIGIVRVSGGKAFDVAKAILHKDLSPNLVCYSHFYDQNGEVIDHGVALFFKKPKSFTGEDILELQGHGGIVSLKVLLDAVLSVEGVRLSEPGEFSRRSFLHGKIDLLQAEAIADLIYASSSQAAKLAIQSLQGIFSKKVQSLIDSLIQLRVFIESSLDFSEEEIDFLTDDEIKKRIDLLIQELQTTIQSAQQGVILKEGISIVIAGKPNVGKSSLLNQLTGEDTAIVTEIPGTTRDVIKEHIHVDGLPLHIIDTAGLRETKDAVEKKGINRARQEIKKADQILWIVDSSLKKTTRNHEDDFPEYFSKEKVIVIHNKIDLIHRKAKIEKVNHLVNPVVYLSAKTGEGIDLLKKVLKESVQFHQEETLFIARKRHVIALNKALVFLNSALNQFVNKNPELFAEDLSAAQKALSEITGAFTTEDLLDKIFSEFCIGK